MQEMKMRHDETRMKMRCEVEMRACCGQQEVEIRFVKCVGPGLADQASRGRGWACGLAALGPPGFDAIPSCPCMCVHQVCQPARDGKRKQGGWRHVI